MAFDPLAAANAAAEYEDQTQVKKFEGGDFAPPAAGKCPARLISYIDLGEHQEEFQGKPKTVDKAFIEFELSGPKHPPITTEDGRKLPRTIGFEITKSFSEKSKFPKLFRMMNYNNSAKHMAQLLNQVFLVEVFHKPNKDASKQPYANLYDNDGVYHIGNPTFENPMTGEKSTIQADERLSPLRLLIWGTATKDMWDSIFIDGTTKDKTNDKGEVIEKGRSRNRFQNKIKSALNFKGSAIEAALLGGGGLDIPDAAKPERSETAVQASADAKAAAKTGASADPLAGI